MCVFYYTGPDEKWSVSRVRRLEGLRPFDHASVERGGGGVTIASTRPFTMTTDSVKEVTPQEGASGDWEMVGRGEQGRDFGALNFGSLFAVGEERVCVCVYVCVCVFTFACVFMCVRVCTPCFWFMQSIVYDLHSCINLFSHSVNTASSPPPLTEPYFLFYRLTEPPFLFLQSLLSCSHRASLSVLTEPHFLFSLSFACSHWAPSCSLTEPLYLFSQSLVPVPTEPLYLFSHSLFACSHVLISCSHRGSFVVHTEPQFVLTQRPNSPCTHGVKLQKTSRFSSLCPLTQPSRMSMCPCLPIRSTLASRTVWHCCGGRYTIESTLPQGLGTLTARSKAAFLLCACLCVCVRACVCVEHASLLLWESFRCYYEWVFRR